jgi:hypothetical protein
VKPDDIESVPACAPKEELCREAVRQSWGGSFQKGFR